MELATARFFVFFCTDTTTADLPRDDLLKPEEDEERNALDRDEEEDEPAIIDIIDIFFNIIIRECVFECVSSRNLCGVTVCHTHTSGFRSIARFRACELFFF